MVVSEADFTCFRYNELNERQKKIYDTVADKIADEYIGSFPVPEFEAEDLQIVTTAIYEDHPEYFYFSPNNCRGRCMRKGDYRYGFQVEITEYVMDSATIEAFQKDLQEYTDKFMSLIPSEGSIDDKINYTVEYIANNTSYNLTAEYNQSLISAVHGESVCAGYTKLNQYLLHNLGVDAEYVIGYTTTGVTGGHAWNICYDEEGAKYVDATWADQITSKSNFIDRKYILQKKLWSSHVLKKGA